MTKKEINAILTSEASKSKKMVELYNGGMEIKEIATLMEVRYNFVYNVVSNMCRMNDVELRTNKDNGNSKKALIIAMFNEGKSNTEIAKELKTNYNYVYKITKEVIANM
jgi:transposase